MAGRVEVGKVRSTTPVEGFVRLCWGWCSVRAAGVVQSVRESELTTPKTNLPDAPKKRRKSECPRVEGQWDTHTRGALGKAESNVGTR